MSALASITSPPAVFLILAALGPAFSVAAQEGRTPPARNRPECQLADGRPNPAVPNPAINCPDVFAWRKFVEVNTPTREVPGKVLWQTWATDPDTFPKQPDPAACAASQPDPEKCPVWPHPGAPGEHGLPAKRNDELHPPELIAAAHAAAAAATGVPADLGALTTETIRRNRVTFDYIVANELWYQEGIKQRFNEGFVVDFPTASIELKFNWLPARYVPDPSRYLSAFFDGELQVVVAMHVSTKDLPNWFWSTFEHVDNPGRCDYIGCWDSFGVEPAFEPPRVELKRPYPAGRLRPALEELMREAGLASAFRYYRLKGAQVDFTDSRGEPTILGNSVTEYGFVPTASCITCHGRAGVDWNGKKPDNLRVFGEKLGGQTFNGPLHSELYYDHHHPFQRYLMQVDFVWAIPFRAQPLGGAQQAEKGRDD